MSIEQKIVELISKIQDGVTTHGPEAMQLVLMIVRVEAIAMLVSCLVVLPLLVILGRRLWVWLGKNVDYDQEMARMLATVVGGVVGLLLAGWALVTLLSPRLWMALIDPRLALAYDVMQKVLGK